MASKCMLLIITITVAIIPTIAFARQYMVGDDKGWGLKVNYTEWAQGKEFFVGDTLVFNYTVGKHNVIKVTGPAFKACKAQDGAPAPLETGNDVVTLATPGIKWYICGFEGHCTGGMKLVITVNELSPAPVSPAPVSPAPVSPAPAPTENSAGVATGNAYLIALLAALVFGAMLKAF